MASITATELVTIGTEESDTIVGREEEDIIDARGGNDLVAGLGGNDAVVGGSGNDYIFGNAGEDNIFGGEGNDTILGVDDNDMLFGQAGNDVIIGGDGSDRLLGNRGSDHLIGGSSSQSLGLDADNFAFNFGPGFGQVGQPSQGNDLIDGFVTGTDVILVAGLDENLDTNSNGRLDDADARVDASADTREAFLTIDFNGVPVVGGDTATGVLTVTDTAELEVGRDILFM